MATKRERARALVAKHQPLVEVVARRLARGLPPHIELDDLISAGVMGLIESSERFDSTLGVRFEAFAEPRIRGAILDDMRVRDTLSRDMRRLSNELRAAAERLESQLGRVPEPDEIARTLGIDVTEFYARQAKLSGSTVVSMEDVGPDRLVVRTAGDTFEDPFVAAARKELAALLASALDALPARERQVISLLYADELTLKDIGAILGVTESRACQIHRSGITMLRAALGDAASP